MPENFARGLILILQGHIGMYGPCSGDTQGFIAAFSPIHIAFRPKGPRAVTRRRTEMPPFKIM